MSAPPTRFFLYFVGAAAAWGVGVAISKRAVAEIPPLALLPIQLSVSVTSLGVVMLGGGLRPRWSPELRRLGWLGVLNPGVSYLLSLAGLVSITASLSVLLWTMEPILILVLAGWFLREKITKPIAVLSLLALGGVALVSWGPASSGTAVGVLLTSAGVAACAVYTVIARKWMADDSTITVVVVQQAAALVFAGIVLGTGIATGATSALGPVSAAAWVSAAGSGLLYYGVAFWFYLSGLRGLPATMAAVSINLIPVFGITAGHLLLGESLGPRQWLGAVLIVGAVAGIAWRPASRQASGAVLQTPHNEADFTSGRADIAEQAEEILSEGGFGED